MTVHQQNEWSSHDNFFHTNPRRDEGFKRLNVLIVSTDRFVQFSREKSGHLASNT